MYTHAEETLGEGSANFLLCLSEGSQWVLIFIQPVLEANTRDMQMNHKT